jgi:hypothetical protein
MNHEYSQTISEIGAALQPLGFAVIRDDNFLYVLENSGKVVVLEGEPYVRGAFNLSVTSGWPQVPEKMFCVRLLMKVFGDEARPSLKNQLKFLTSHMAILFDHPESYEAQYRYLNGG